MCSNNDKNNNFSILMSCYNDYGFTDIAINSVLNQTYKNFEFIIINDGSNHETTSKLNEIKNKDSRVKLFNKDNTGLTKSLNFGINRCKYEWIARIDSDDYWDKKKIK